MGRPPFTENTSLKLGVNAFATQGAVLVKKFISFVMSGESKETYILNFGFRHTEVAGPQRLRA
jgi:hypothetical protein